MNNGRDFDKLSILLNKLANIFEKSYSEEESWEVIDLYFKYMYTYFTGLSKLLSNKDVSTSEEMDLIRSSYKKFLDQKSLTDGLIAIRYLRQSLGILENHSYNVNYQVMNNNIATKENALNNQKIISASQHYKYFFEMYELYNKICTNIESKEPKSKEIIQSNITVISEFHQGITHFSRYINSGNIREVYRFDSHFIRAIFDIQKLIISTLDHYAVYLKDPERNILLLAYINVKNIEVPGRNMSNFNEVYVRYNEVIKNYREVLTI